MTTGSQPNPNAKHVLIVEDDEVFRGILEKALKSAGYQVSVASNGKTAQDVIGFETLDAIVSDINLPGVNGIELLHFTKRVHPALPVILMTGFAELKETTEAHALGATDFIAKPFKREELLATLGRCFSNGLSSKPGVEEDLDAEFCKLSIDDFVTGHEIQFDIFIRVSPNRYIKIAHQGENIPIERIRSYKAKDLRYLYLRKDDFRTYMGISVSMLPLVRAKSTLSKEKKIAFLKHTAEVVLERVHVKGVDKEAFHGASVVVESTLSMLSELDEVLNLLTLLNSHADFLYAHSVGVGLYGVMMAKEIQWTSPANLYKLAMAGIFHDIGKKEIDRAILIKQRKDLTADEVKIYESHAYRGVDILGQLPYMPGDVVQVAAQHHENCLGLGFPVGLPKTRIHPMARLLAVANEFCSLALNGPSSQGIPPEDAIRKMIALNADKLDPAFFLALMRVFKLKPPPGFGTSQSRR